MIIISSKEFNQRASAILKLSQTEPVYITKWGKIVSVLSNLETFQAAQKQNEPSFEQLFGQNAPEISDDFADEFDRELTRIRQNSHLRVADFSEIE